jgi:hypothetical protein
MASCITRESKQNELLLITESAVQGLTKQHQRLDDHSVVSHPRPAAYAGVSASVVSREDASSTGSSSTTASKVLINSTSQRSKLVGADCVAGLTGEIQAANKVRVPARSLNKILSPHEESLPHDQYVVDESDEQVVNISLAKRHSQPNPRSAAVSTDVEHDANGQASGAFQTRNSETAVVAPASESQKRGDAHPLMVMLDSGYLTQPIRTVVAEETAASLANSDSSSSPIIVHARDMEISQSESGKLLVQFYAWH